MCDEIFYKNSKINIHKEKHMIKKLIIKKLGINGEGIGYLNRKIVFVPGALPKELVLIKLTSIKTNFYTAKLIKIIKSSPFRVKPIDGQLATLTGGLELSHLRYDQQLIWKRKIIQQALRKFHPKNYQQIKIFETIGMDNPYFYRNKLQFTTKQINNRLCAGLYQNNSHKLIPIKKISTQNPTTMDSLNKVVDILNRYHIKAYDEKTDKGILRNIVLRSSNIDQKIQLTFITNTPKIPNVKNIIKDINQEIPNIISIYQNVNSQKTPLIWGDKTEKLFGTNYIQEKILNCNFLVSPRSFLQLNPIQTEKLYTIAKQLINDSFHNLLDAYSGIGTLGISLANKFKQVKGIENIPEAVKDANLNAQQNHINNAQFYCGTVENLLPNFISKNWFPDVLIVDPPRSGIDKKLIQLINKLDLKQFIYISCNPSTFARDLTYLNNYKVKSIQPIDMFPQTPNVELVANINKRG